MTTILKDGFQDFEFQYYEKQAKIFFEDEHRFRIVSKGRRTGFTHGAANYSEECCVDPSILSYQFPGVKSLKILWVDTVQTNIDRYVERYFLPNLKPLKREYYTWRQQKKELQIMNSYIDFRSADRPENIEGFGYHLMILNEAGIILKGERGRYLWENALLPMAMDFGALCLIGGTPKGKTDKKTAKDNLYYSMYKRCISEGDNDRNWSENKIIPEDNPFLSQDDVKLLREELTGDVAKQELDGDFVDIGTEEIFKREWMQYVEEYELEETYNTIFSSWDTAFGKGEENDFSSQTTFAVSDRYIDIVDWWEGQVNFPELKEKFSSVANGDEAALPRLTPWKAIIEGKATGDPLLDEIEESSIYPTERIIPIGDKISRANSITDYFKGRKVRILRADWTSKFVNRLISFPEGGRDTTDTVSQGLSSIRENTRTTIQGEAIRTRRVNIRSRVD